MTDCSRHQILLPDASWQLGTGTTNPPRARRVSQSSFKSFILLRGNDISYEGQLPELVRHVHTVADDKLVGALEAHEVRRDMRSQVTRLVEQHGGVGTLGAPRRQKILREGKRPARLEDVVDQEHITALHIGLNVAQHVHLARRLRGLPVGGEDHEIDLGTEAGVVHGADEVRSKNEAAFEYRHHEKVGGFSRSNFGRDDLNAGRDFRLAEEDPDAVAVDDKFAHGGHLSRFPAAGQLMLIRYAEPNVDNAHWLSSLFGRVNASLKLGWFKEG